MQAIQDEILSHILWKVENHTDTFLEEDMSGEMTLQEQFLDKIDAYLMDVHK